MQAMDSSPVIAAIKRKGPHVLLARRLGRSVNDPILKYLQRQDTLEFDRMPVNWPLNGLHGDEYPDAWEPLTEWPGGEPPTA
jgi:hypothetical protein